MKLINFLVGSLTPPVEYESQLADYQIFLIVVGVLAIIIVPIFLICYVVSKLSSKVYHEEDEKSEIQELREIIEKQQKEIDKLKSRKDD